MGSLSFEVVDLGLIKNTGGKQSTLFVVHIIVVSSNDIFTSSSKQHLPSYSLS